MSDQLLKEWNRLDHWSKSAIRNTFTDSPKIKLLIQFLDKNKVTSINSIIHFIYPELISKTSKSVLENRYYKLRKTLLDKISQQQIKEIQYPQEETIWLYCQELLLKNEKEKAYSELQLLEKTCLQNNIFELLPKIADSKVFLNQSFNISNTKSGALKNLSVYVKLHHAILELNLIARNIHEKFVISGFSAIRSDLLRVKKLAIRYAEYPRFKMCFLHLNLYYKLASPEHITKQNGLSRYHNAFLQLFQKHSEIPLLSYRLHYKSLQRFHFLQIQVMFYYNRFEYTEALQSMKQLWELVNNEINILGIYKTEPLYFNLATAYLINDDFENARKVIHAYKLEIQTNNKKQRNEKAEMELFIIYSLQHINNSIRPGLEEKKGLQYILSDSPDKSGPLQFLRNQLALMRWHIINNEFEAAQRLSRSNPLSKELKKIKLENCIEDLIKFNVEERIRKYKNQLHQAVHPEQYAMHRWLIKFSSL